MEKKKLELQTSYIADAIIQTKKKRFNEEFTTLEEVNIVKQLIQKRIELEKLDVELVDGFFKKYFNIINGVITKADKETPTLKVYISDLKIRLAIYDEDFIYLCICEIMCNKLYNSIEHTCSNCSTLCYDTLPPQQVSNCKMWKCDFMSETKKSLKKSLSIKK